MTGSLEINASIGAQTDRELDIVDCAIDHISVVAQLYPDGYTPINRLDVFRDIKELFFITLTTNCKDMAGKDNRAVGMSDLGSPFITNEAKGILSRTSFVSRGSGWEVEVRSSTHAGTLVEATAEYGCEDEDLHDHDDIPSTEPNTETEGEPQGRAVATDENKTESKVVDEGREENVKGSDRP